MNKVPFVTLIIIIIIVKESASQCNCTIPIKYTFGKCERSISIIPPFKAQDTILINSNEFKYKVYLENCNGRAKIFEKDKKNDFLVAEYEFSESIDTLIDYYFLTNLETYETIAKTREIYKALPSGVWIFYNRDGTIKERIKPTVDYINW